MQQSRGVFTHAAAALFTLAAVLPAAATAEKRGGSESRAVTVATIDIDNFGRINDAYFRGEQPEGRDYGDLAALGVKTVIDLQADGDNYDEAQLVTSAGMTFLRIPMTTHVAPTPAQLALFLETVSDPARQPVYVHCKGGKHRTGVLTAVYRMERDDWNADRAFKEMKRYDFGWDFLHPEFKRFVYGYKPQGAAVAAASRQTATSDR